MNPLTLAAFRALSAVPMTPHKQSALAEMAQELVESEYPDACLKADETTDPYGIYVAIGDVRYSDVIPSDGGDINYYRSQCLAFIDAANKLIGREGE